jgi:hypothetical protein
MRTTIRQLLIDGVPAVNGRVFEPHEADHQQASDPFLVVEEGDDDLDPELEWAALSTITKVWSVVPRSTFTTVDQLAAAAIQALNGARFAEGGTQYLARYVGTVGEDAPIEELDAITRTLRFQVFALGWLAGLTYNPDPVSALRSWIASTWPELQTDPSTWTPSNANPAVYWRIEGLPRSEPTNWGAWLDAQFRAHVIAPSAATRLTWVRRITEGLALQGRVKLSDGSPLLFSPPAADMEADPMRAGQVRLAARFGVLRALAAAQLLNHAVISGDIQEEVS